MDTRPGVPWPHVGFDSRFDVQINRAHHLHVHATALTVDSCDGSPDSVPASGLSSLPRVWRRGGGGRCCLVGGLVQSLLAAPLYVAVVLNALGEQLQRLMLPIGPELAVGAEGYGVDLFLHGVRCLDNSLAEVCPDARRIQPHGTGKSGGPLATRGRGR
ncbi:hypothetical protein ACH492_38430 [Streptomyces sp. NPDC019443]|uniref:hypothetical protein n=1 Tax=Streptomyces sp. NPDC019443 TaxID=3365061 RepID=UPI0037B78204